MGIEDMNPSNRGAYNLGRYAERARIRRKLKSLMRCWNFQTIDWLLAQFGDRKKAKRQKQKDKLAAWRAARRR